MFFVVNVSGKVRYKAKLLYNESFQHFSPRFPHKHAVSSHVFLSQWLYLTSHSLVRRIFHRCGFSPLSTLALSVARFARYTQLLNSNWKKITLKLAFEQVFAWKHLTQYSWTVFDAPVITWRSNDIEEFYFIDRITPTVEWRHEVYSVSISSQMLT